MLAHIKEHGSESAKGKAVRNPNGLYNMLARMLEDGQIAKVGDKFYSLELYSKLSDAGELDEDAYSESPTGKKSAFLDVFEKFGPMTPKSVMELLRNHDEVGPMLASRPQYAYNMLARLVRQGQLVKNGSFYALPSQYVEPDDGSGSSARARNDSEDHSTDVFS